MLACRRFTRQTERSLTVTTLRPRVGRLRGEDLENADIWRVHFLGAGSERVAGSRINHIGNHRPRDELRRIRPNIIQMMGFAGIRRTSSR